MGVVYRALHVNLQRTVAVKILRQSSAEAKLALDWQREPRLMASLAHPHVVTIHDAGEADGCAYLVMEYMAGGSLRSRIEPGKPWPVKQAMKMLGQIAQALEHVHAQGVLHLDLKPENILYTADRQVRVTDFGLSLAHTDAKSPIDGQPLRGTAAYCPPEQRTGLALDARSDVFSLASIAYELFTGQVPGRVFVPASSLNGRLPLALDNVLRCGLSRHPQDRYASVAQFWQALDDACCDTGQRISRRTKAALVIAASLLLLVLGAVWLRTTALPRERISDLWLLLDRPDQHALLGVTADLERANRGALTIHSVNVHDSPGSVPPSLPLPFWPNPRPVALVRSPIAWGFVVPLQEPSLVDRTVRDWPELLQATTPSTDQFVHANGFDGDCLASGHRGQLWRVADFEGVSETRQISVRGPPNRPNNRALTLTNLSTGWAEEFLGCYQMLKRSPEPGAVLVLRYTARSVRGVGRLAVYAELPVSLPPDETGPVSTTIRTEYQPMPPNTGNATSDLWKYRRAIWTTPSTEWQTFLVVMDSPPFPVESEDSKLVIVAAGTDEVSVDDVQFFPWSSESTP